MEKQKQIGNWKAQWIWNNQEISPRNEWWCLRNTIDIPESGWDEASISITADSRYVLYVNGESVGRGPVRSWPFEQAYDKYDINHLLKPGRKNCIAVIVLHFGVSTFSYVRGRGGLLAQLELLDNGQCTQVIGTDSSWKIARHLGQDSRAPRMCCQQAFSEQIDARLWDNEWIFDNYDDSNWENATIIGAAGMEPWTGLKQRDIPYLTEEIIWPARVESLKKVKSVEWTTSIDVRNHMVPDSANHANQIGYVGYIATVIKVKEPANAIIGFPMAVANFGPCSLNGKWFEFNNFFGELPERYLKVELKKGENLFIMDVSGVDHGRGLHIGIDCDTPFEVISPIQTGCDASPFISIGPFETFVTYDHQPAETKLLNYKFITDNVFDSLRPGYNDKLDENAFDTFEYYNKVKSIASSSELAEVRQWLRPISSKLVSRDSIFSLCVWRKEETSLPVPYSMQNAVIPNPLPAEVTLYEEDTEIVVDFGKMLSGYISFEVEADAGTIIDCYGFEYMMDGWREDTHDLDNTLRYTCKDGRQAYTSKVRRGLRYLMVTIRNATQSVNVYGIKMLQSNYPISEIGRFKCSDALLNDIWQISQYATKLCMEDTFVDCPTYEQTFWVGDSRNASLINYYVFGDTDIVKRCLRLVPGSKSQTPLYSDQVPGGWSSVIPNWTFFWVNACYEYYFQTGDCEFVKEILPHILYTLEHYLQKLDDRGLLFMNGWNMLDWAKTDQPNRGVVSHQNMFLVKALRDAAMLSGVVGDKEDETALECKAENLAAAINTYLWSEKHSAYLDCIHADGRESTIFSMQTQVVAYLCDIAAKERSSFVEGYLKAPPEDYVQIGSPFMTFFYYEALSKMKQFDKIIEDMRKNYGIMVDHDATTCWELYPSSDYVYNKKMPTRSHCHAWSAAPAYFLGNNVLGVKAIERGWGKVLVEPQISGLTWARGTVPLPGQGRIDVSWRVLEDERKLLLKIGAPKGIEIIINLPEGYKGEIETREI